MKTFIFGVEENGITIRSKGRLLGRFSSGKEMKALSINIAEQDVVMFSSSMDFPDEYTKNKKVLALARKLRKA